VSGDETSDEKRPPRWGEIYELDFGQPRGTEQAGQRPAVVVSNNIVNSFGRIVIVAAVTTNLTRAQYPQNVLIPAGILPQESVILTEQLLTIDQQRLLKLRGAVDSERTANLKVALKTMLELE
jgi:mRNA interferase MazF